MSKEEIKKAQEKVVAEGKDAKTKKSKEEPKKEAVKNTLEDIRWNKTEAQEEALPDREKQKLAVKELETLEQALKKEQIPEQIRSSEYTKELSREPVQVLYDQAKALAQRAEEKGYLSQTEQRQIEYITGAIEEKVESGEYSFTEEAARKASLTLQLASQSRSLYKSSSTDHKSWYKSG